MRYKGPGEKPFIPQRVYVQDDKVIVEVPLFIRSHANSQCHWSLRAQRVREERNVGRLMGLQAIALGQLRLAWPESDAMAHSLWNVNMIRISTNMIRDSDNLAFSFKSMRDGIADAYATDDCDLGPKKGIMTWQYGQEKRRVYGVRIELKRLSAISSVSAR